MRRETAIVMPNSNIATGTGSSFLNKAPLQFLIMDAPRSGNLNLYIRECKRHNVTDIVRVCEPTYVETNLKKAGIALHEMPYPDGHSPPDDVLDRWLKLVDEKFIHPTAPPSPTNTGLTSSVHADSVHAISVHTNSAHTNSAHGPAHSEVRAKPKVTGPTIAVHCVAGLGRAPVLVAIALIEFAKMDPIDAATFIRKHRQGAINNKQLDWLEQYKRRYKRVSSGGGCCVVM